MRADEIRSGKPKPDSVSHPIPWKQGDPTPPDVHYNENGEKEICVIVDGVPTTVYLGYDDNPLPSWMVPNLNDPESIMEFAKEEKEDDDRRRAGLPSSVTIAEGEQHYTAAEIAAKAAMDACPDDMSEDQKLEIGKAAAFSYGFAATTAALAGLKWIFGRK